MLAVPRAWLSVTMQNEQQQWDRSAVSVSVRQKESTVGAGLKNTSLQSIKH